MNLLPVNVCGTVDDDYFFTDVQFNWSIDATIDINESHPLYGITVYLRYEKLVDEDGTIHWSITSQDYPWYNINALESDYTESEIEMMKSLHNQFESEKPYIENCLDNNLLAYENIANGKCAFWVTRRGEFIRRYDVPQSLKPTQNLSVVEENNNRYNAYSVHSTTNAPLIVPEVDYSGIFIKTPFEEQQKYKDQKLIEKIAAEQEQPEEDPDNVD